MKKFTLSTTKQMRKELRTEVTGIVEEVYGKTIETFRATLEARLKDTRAASLRCFIRLDEDKRFNGEIPYQEGVDTIKSSWPASDPQRGIAYQYLNYSLRGGLLASLLNSKQSLTTVVKESLINIMLGIIHNSKGSGITLNEAISKVKLKVSEVVYKSGTIRPLTSSVRDLFIVDEVKATLLTELAELDMLDIKRTDRTHMVDIPKAIAKLIDKNLLKELRLKANLIDRKTVLLEPADIDYEHSITQSSWYYRTPNLSAAQIEYMNIMNNIKYSFKPDAVDKIEEVYMEHIRKEDGNLPDNWQQWVPAKIEFLKEQIIASNNNGGHYIAHQWDSALRTYMIAEIGHHQTSKALRSLVTINGILNPVKKDFRNNVLQMYALLTKTKSPAKFVGLLRIVELEEDVRIQIAVRANIALQTDVFNKDNIKPLFMIWAYNAGKDRLLEGTYTEIEDWYTGELVRETKTPGLLKLCGAADTKSNRDLIYTAFETIVTELVPIVVIIKKRFRELIKHNPLLETKWTMPDGSIAQYASPESVSALLRWGTSKGDKGQHTHHKKILSENVKSGGLLPRVIHSFDAYIARTIVIRAYALGIIVVPNHDSFTFDAQHEEVVDNIIKEVMISLLESDAFYNVITELNVSKKPLRINDELGQAITQARCIATYGLLTAEDIMASNPTSLEEI